jgi:uncharacterized protein (TIGR03435 family)
MRTLVVALLVASTVALAQAPATDGLRFEVVSIKRNTSNALGSNGSSERPDGGFTLLNVPMMTLVGRAQFPGIAPIDMVGLPDWSRSERYDVIATSPLGRPATPQERAAMMRAMLADRVKLATHLETRELPAYDLVLARSDKRLGPGIKPSEMDCVAKAEADRAAAEAARLAGKLPPPPTIPDMKAPPPVCGPLRLGNGIEGDTTMANLARMLRGLGGVDRPVVDKTGLTGSYRIKTEFDLAMGQRGPDLAPSQNALPTLFTALQEQLGMKLESSTTMREVLVVDRLERPTEN